MKMIMFFALVFSSMIVSADKLAMTSDEVKKLTPEQREARKKKMEQIIRQRTGGFVIKEGTGKGLVVLIDAQKAVDPEVLKRPLNFIRKRLRLPVAYRAGTIQGLPTESKVNKTGGSVAIFVVDDKTIEAPLLVAPEKRWALVNVGALSIDRPTKDGLSLRTAKEVSRAFGYLCGSANSQYQGTIMDVKRSVAELDGNSSVDLPIDQFQRIINYMKRLGVEPYVEATYRSACQQGWAPDPEDEFQKAIWDEFHEKPTKPKKIIFDPKKGE